MYVSGSPSTPPLKPFGELSYYAASLFSAVGILLALRKRTLTGHGEHVDISLQEAVVSTLDHVMVRYFYDRIISKRQGNRSWNGSSCILPCKDGYLHLTLSQQWETLVEWMASEEMAEDLVEDKWKDGEYRLRNMDHVIEVLQRWTMTHHTQELFELGQLMHFPWAPVYSPEDVLNNPQLKARGFFSIPYKFSSLSLKWGKRAPRMGEDNAKIYQGELGLTDEELRRLSSMGVI